MTLSSIKTQFTPFHLAIHKFQCVNENMYLESEAFTHTISSFLYGQEKKCLNIWQLWKEEKNVPIFWFRYLLYVKLGISNHGFYKFNAGALKKVENCIWIG